MDTPDQVTPPKKRGRPAKKEVAPGEHLVELAKQHAADRDSNPVVDKYYELVAGKKLCLVKKKKSGKTVSEYVGTIEERRDAPPEYQARRNQLINQIKRLRSEGRLKERL